MNLKAATLAIAQLLASTALAAHAGPVCDVQSGPTTAALVELYTSEGCSSCPPADRALSRLAESLAPSAEFVPLALHVGYWDSLGWTDRFAQDRFAQRHSWLVQTQGHRTVYTPQFFVAGAELQPGRAYLPGAVQRLNATPARAAIRLRTALSADGVLSFDANASTHAGDDAAALYLAVAENGLQTRVQAGENRGATLTHDHVVRQWLGPFPLHDGAARVQREVRLVPDWRRENLEMAAFVENERTGEVQQAVRAAACAGS